MRRLITARVLFYKRHPNLYLTISTCISPLLFIHLGTSSTTSQCIPYRMKVVVVYLNLVNQVEADQNLFPEDTQYRLIKIFFLYSNPILFFSGVIRIAIITRVWAVASGAASLQKSKKSKKKTLRKDLISCVSGNLNCTRGFRAVRQTFKIRTH